VILYPPNLAGSGPGRDRSAICIILSVLHENYVISGSIYVTVNLSKTKILEPCKRL
jgi:hypothetical protein